MPWRGQILACILVAGCVAAAQTAPRVKYAAPHNVSAADGSGMFRAYCSVCHGLDGQGDGPAASSLRKRPADLTQLSRKYGGKFPAYHVANMIRGDDVTAAHGSRDMPIWGTVFRSLGPGTVKLRVDNLTRYIESIQRP